MGNGRSTNSRVSTTLDEAQLDKLVTKTGLSREEIKKMHVEFLVTKNEIFNKFKKTLKFKIFK